LSQTGWRIAKQIANENGPILAKFIDSFKDECQGSKLRIIAHSLGSRVTLSAIQSLYDDYIIFMLLLSNLKQLHQFIC
jgi:esterase/lipase superfamily enzyme